MAVGSLVEIPQNIAFALSLASSATGADYDYLAHTAYRESRFQVNAQARTSSAQGLFQFIEETWLMTVKNDGSRFGLEEYANRIFKTRSGRHYVPDAKQRAEILNLRRDPKIASLMAGVFARNNGNRLAGKIGRQPTPGELYLAHFLGASDAIRMIILARSNPNRSAADAFPAAAKANRRIFYDGKHARSARQVYLSLVRSHNRSKKSRTFVRTLASKIDKKMGSGNLKKHLRTRASSGALNARSRKLAVKRKPIVQKKWATVVRPAAKIRAAAKTPESFRGAIAPHKSSEAKRRHVARR